MKITLIAAISENNVIGKNGKIPWNIPEDLGRFKKLTLEHPIIMGRKTYESLPEKSRPLPKRKNIVMSNSLSPTEGIYVAKNLEEALKLAENKDAYVIGGEEIYRLFLPVADKLEITRVHKKYEGDSFFPQEIEWSEWGLLNEKNGTSKNEKVSYSFLTYSRLFNKMRMIIN